MRLRALSLALALLALAAAPARAAKEFARLERVEVSPTVVGLAKVRLWVSLVHLQGALMDVKPDDLRLMVGKSQWADRPGITPYDQTEGELQIVVVVEVGAGFAAGLNALKDPGVAFLKDLPKGTQVAVVPYGSKKSK